MPRRLQEVRADRWDTVFGHSRPTAPFDGAVQEGDGKVEASSLTAAVASDILWANELGEDI